MYVAKYAQIVWLSSSVQQMKWILLYITDTAKYTGPRTFTDKKTLGPVKPVSFMVLLSEEDFSILLPFSLFSHVKLQ